MNKRYILFDLDGTLTDPKIGITKSVQYSLKSLGITVDDLDTLLPFIGPPLRDSYKQFYDMNDADAERAVTAYREYFAESGIFENMLYPGITDLLAALCDKGKILLLATAKPTIFAERILKYFDMARYFSFVAGCEMDGRRSQKGEVIRYALDAMRLSFPPDAMRPPSSTISVMIGDRVHDIRGARENGLDSIGVLYGYGNAQELSGATALAPTVADLAALLEID